MDNREKAIKTYDFGILKVFLLYKILQFNS